jgi:hypothetical protein
MPWVVKMIFCEDKLIEMEKIDLFEPYKGDPAICLK